METPRRRCVNAGAVCSPLVPKTRNADCPGLLGMAVGTFFARCRRAGGVKEIFRIADPYRLGRIGATPCCSLTTLETVEADTPATAQLRSTT